MWNSQDNSWGNLIFTGGHYAGDCSWWHVLTTQFPPQNTPCNRLWDLQRHSFPSSLWCPVITPVPTQSSVHRSLLKRAASSLFWFQQIANFCYSFLYHSLGLKSFPQWFSSLLAVFLSLLFSSLRSPQPYPLVMLGCCVFLSQHACSIINTSGTVPSKTIKWAPLSPPSVHHRLSINFFKVESQVLITTEESHFLGYFAQSVEC